MNNANITAYTCSIYRLVV